MNNLVSLFNKFEDKYKCLDTIDCNWYKDNCGVFANCKKTKVRSKDGNFTEEWYRARMVWSLVESGFPKENICVEFKIPKGSQGAKSINPDIIVFKDSSWISVYNSWDKESALPDDLRKNMLIVFEAKVNSKKLVSAVTKQLAEAMNSYIGEEIFGIYFDNEYEILMFSKESTHSIRRYYIDKNIDGEGIEKLNLNNRDEISSMPQFNEFLDRIRIVENVGKLNFKTNLPITEDNFTDILVKVNRLQDRLDVSHVQDLIVEFITLKVADERAVLNKERDYFNFYIKDSEKNADGTGSNSFRKRIVELYEKAEEYFPTIMRNKDFEYNKRERSNDISYIPRRSDDEKFLIGMIEVIQKKIILNNNTNYNQIIFNNFGSNIDKAKEKQFFTPLHVVDAIVRMINPKVKELICDPCAGICDFLAVSHKFLQTKSPNSNSNLYGFDKDPKILKLALLNLILNGDGNAIIKTMDSITTKLLKNNEKSSEFNINNYLPEDWTHMNDSQKDIKQYDVVITNPPFGRGRDLKTGKKGVYDVQQSTLNLYETWSVAGKPLTMDMGIIFLENAYKILKPGGRMAIVLSNSIAGILQWQEVRRWLIDKMRIVALVDLPQDTFSETGVATTVIIAYKPFEYELDILNKDYEVFIKNIEHIGYQVKTTDRIVVMKPVFEINPKTLQRVKDSNGNEKRLTDLPELVNGFKDWLDSIKHTDESVYKAFDGNNFSHWEV